MKFIACFLVALGLQRVSDCIALELLDTAGLAVPEVEGSPVREAGALRGALDRGFDAIAAGARVSKIMQGSRYFIGSQRIWACSQCAPNVSVRRLRHEQPPRDYELSER